MDNSNDVSMGKAYVIFEEESGRSAAMKMSGKLFCGEIIGVKDDKYGFGRNAYEFHDSLFDSYISIGETRKRGPKGGHSISRSKYVGRGSGRFGPGPHRGESQ